MNKFTKVSLLCVGLVLILTATSQVSTTPEELPEGSFHISQHNFQTNTWEERYTADYKVEYSEKSFVLWPQNEKLRIRIVQKDLPFGDIEQVSLSACGNTLIPKYARYVDTSESVLEDITHNDLNVITNHERPVEIQWNIPTDCKEGTTLLLVANEYISIEENYLRFPKRGEGTETYVFRNSGTISVDGYIDEVDNIVRPDFSAYWEPTTGHPKDYVHFYLNDDSDYVYLSADILIDNTNESEDWFETTVYNGSGTPVNTYRITDADTTYGTCTLGITSKVTYKHQICELKIPKEDIDGGDYIIFSIQYYGTASEDTTPPEITINDGTPSPTTDRSPYVTGTATETQSAVLSVEYQVDDTLGVWSGCSPDDGWYSELEEDFTCDVTPDLTLGSHTIYLRATNYDDHTTANGSEPSYSIVVEEEEEIEEEEERETFKEDTRCHAQKPSKPTWINLTRENRNGIGGILLTWTQYSANKITIKIDDGTGRYPWKIDRTANDGHEFLQNVQPWQKIKIRPINDCSKGDYAEEVSLNKNPFGWYNLQ